VRFFRWGEKKVFPVDMVSRDRSRAVQFSKFKVMLVEKNRNHIHEITKEGGHFTRGETNFDQGLN